MAAQEYQIVKSWQTEILQERVNKLIAEGWEPLGGVIYAEGDYIQAMVKR